jgi:phosphoglycolate phosphatase
MQAIRHVIWDFNGTLLDDVRCCLDALATLLEERGLPVLSEHGYRDLFGFPVRDFYTAIGFDFERETFDSVSETFIARYVDRLEHARPHRHALEALAWLAARNVAQSVLSAMEQVLLAKLLARYGLGDHLTHVRGLSDLNASSKVQLGVELMAQLALPPESVLLVGDTLHDHETAQALGCHCLLVAHGHQHRARLERALPYAARTTEVVDSLEDVLRWIEAHGGERAP